MRLTCVLAVMCIVSSSAHADTLVEYRFEGNGNDASGFGLHGQLIGDATIQDGRLFLPGDFDNSFSIPLGEFNPFDGTTNWTLSFEFQTVDESAGPLFSSDGSSEEDDPDLPWPDSPINGDQTGSLNVFISPEDGTLRTDFWYIDVVASQNIYNDDEPHTYVGTYDAETGEFIQTIDEDDESFGTFLFERDIAFDRTFVGDESNGDFGIEFNPEGFHGFFDNLVIDSSGDLPPTALPGDFDANGVLEHADVNALSALIATGGADLHFDLNADGSVSDKDLEVWVKELRKTWIGDANLDGEFNSTDLVEVFQSGKFETDVDSKWEDGDWTADFRFNSTDFVAAFQDGGFEQGPLIAETVPEPSGLVLACVAVFGILFCVRIPMSRRCWR